jgi:tetratricopeptide (TPR) repeat protein
MANFIGITLCAAVLQFAAQAAAQVPGELAAHNQVANHEQLSDAASLHQRARRNLDDGNHTRALEDLHASIQLNPYYTQAYYLRGQIFAKQKDFTQAIHDFDKAISQDSSFASALHQRALAHQESRDYRQALKDFDSALALEPLNALTLRDRAIAHRDAGNYDQAVDDYEEAMRLGFSAVDPHPMADLLFFQGRFLQSAQTLQQVVRHRPGRTTSTPPYGAISLSVKPKTIAAPRASLPSNRCALRWINAGQRPYSNIISVRSTSLLCTPPLRQLKKALRLSSAAKPIFTLPKPSCSRAPRTKPFLGCWRPKANACPTRHSFTAPMPN